MRPIYRFHRGETNLDPVQQEVLKSFESLGIVCSGRFMQGVSLKTAETAVAHNMASVPTDCYVGIPSVRTDIWQSRPPDKDNLYLVSSTACIVSLWVF